MIMSNEAAMPARFSADGLPNDGLVEIFDSETGRSGTIPLSSFPHVTSLLRSLFPEDATMPEELRPSTLEDAKPKAVDFASDRKVADTKKSQDAVSKNISEETESLEVAAETSSDVKPAAKTKSTRKKTATKASKGKTAPPSTTAKKKPKPSSKPSSKKSSNTAQLEVIVGMGFRMVPAEDGSPRYDIVRDDGRNGGTVTMLKSGSFLVEPAENTGHDAQEYTTIVGAKARVFGITR